MSGVLRVVQLNAGTLLEAHWDQRRNEVVAWLQRLDPDVVCLQEVWSDESTPDAATWLADQMPEAGWASHFDGFAIGQRLWKGPEIRFGSAIMSRWAIDDAAVHRLPVHASDEDPFVQDVPWSLLHVQTAGLDIFSTHLSSAPVHSRHRKLQVVAIDEIIRNSKSAQVMARGAGNQREGMPPILCGDFNAEPESDEIRFLSSLTELDGRTTYYQDAWRVAGDGPGYTQDWRRNPSAAALNVPRKRIDYVFVGDPFSRREGGGRVLSAQLAFDEPLTGVLASDHFGLAVEVVWPNRPE